MSICLQAPNLALTYKYLHSLPYIYLHVSKFTNMDEYLLINKHLHSRIRIFIHSDIFTTIKMHTYSPTGIYPSLPGIYIH